MFVVVMAAMAANLGSCKVENAVYQQRSSAPSITASFMAVASAPEWPSGVALRIHFGNTGRTYWWLPWNGGTNGQQNLASTTDVTAPDWKLPSVEAGPRPLGDVSYLGMDAQYNVLQSVPKRGEPAPAHFLIPDLRSALWYRTAPDQRDGDARQFFDLVGCNGS